MQPVPNTTITAQTASVRGPLFATVFTLIAFVLAYLYAIELLAPADGFSSSLSGITKSVNSMTNTVSGLPKEMDSKINAMGKNIEKGITTKFVSFADQFGDVMYDSIVSPLLVLFEGLGRIFISLFSVIGSLGLKVAMLPMCIIPYMFGGIGSVFQRVYDAVLPSLIRTPIRVVYEYTLGPVLGFFAYITGISWILGKCYGFNISRDLNSMKSDLGQIQSDFKKNFGKFNFSKIKV